MAVLDSGEWFQCDHEDCESIIKNHYWGYVKSDRWFFGKDGKGYCPIHIPDWVAEWRKKKKESGDDQ